MKQHRWIPLLLLLVTLGVFWEVPHQQFTVWDEATHITGNQYYDPVTLPNVLYFWRHDYFGMYIPVTYTAWALIARFARTVPVEGGGLALNPHLFHAANLLVHLLNVLLVYALLRRLVGRPWAAGAGALLFALHPLQVEPVAWVAGMKDLLSAFFSLLALWLYLVHGSARRPAYLLATVAYLLALLAKPSGVVVPLMAFALDRWVLGRPRRESLRALAPWLALALPLAIVAGREQDAEQAAFIPAAWLRPFVAGDALAFYLGKLLWPVGLCADYGRTPERVLGSAWGYLTWMAPAALAVLLWWQRRRLPVLVGAGVAFAAGLLPVLGLVPFAFQRHSTVADRYAYLALLAPALVLAWALSRARTAVGPALTVLALCLLAGASAFQTLPWYGDETLWPATLARNPESWTAHHNLALTLQRQGKEEDARAHYGAALRLRPDAPETLVNLGYLAELRGDAAGARAHYDEAIRHQPDYPAARVNLAALLTRLGQYEEAISHCRHALRVQPDFTDAHLNLAVALDARGESSAAIPHAQAAARLQPRNAKIHYTLGNVLLNAGREAEAVHSFRRALALRPEYTEARVNLAVTLGKLGQTEESIREYEHVLRLEPAFGQVRYNLGLLLEEQGRWAEAAEQYRAVLREAPGFTGVRLRLAQVLERLGQTAEAAALRRSVPGKGMEKTGEPATHAR